MARTYPILLITAQLCGIPAETAKTGLTSIGEQRPYYGVFNDSLVSKLKQALQTINTDVIF